MGFDLRNLTNIKFGPELKIPTRFFFFLKYSKSNQIDCYIFSIILDSRSIKSQTKNLYYTISLQFCLVSIGRYLFHTSFLFLYRILHIDVFILFTKSIVPK